MAADSKSDLISNAEKAVLDIAEVIGEKLNAKDVSLEKLKTQITVSDITNGGKKVTGVSLPEDAFNDFAKNIAAKIDATSITEYKKDGWAVQIYNQIVNALQTIKPIKKSGYTVTFNPIDWIMEGVGNVSAEVTWGNYTATLTWKNFSEKTLQGYFDALSQFNKDVWKEFRTALLSDSVKVFKAIYGIGTTMISEVFSNKIIKKATKSEFLNYVKKLAPKDKELANQIKAFENLSKKYTALKNAGNFTFDSKAKDFLKACNALELSLGLTETSLSDVYSLNLNNETKGKVIVPIFYKNTIEETDYPNAGIVTIDASSHAAIKITGNSNSNVIYGGNGKDTIYGGVGNDSICGNNGNDKLFGDSGNDTLNGGLGNDILTGGAGNDVFYYTNGDGADVITDYAAGDKIYIDGANSVSSSMKNNDATFKIGTGSIKLQKAKGTEITIEYSNGKFEKYLNGNLTESGTIANIPDDATYYNGHYYKIYQDGMTWNDAKTFCENLGGHLAVINDAAENSALFTYMNSQGYTSAYFGLSDAEKEGTWKWVNGDTLTYTNWASGEPNNEGRNEDYGMFYWKFTTGKWNDGNFGGSTNRGGNAFICEWDNSNVSAKTAEIFEDNNFIDDTNIDSLLDIDSVGEISFGTSNNALAQDSDNKIDNNAEIIYYSSK